MPGVALGEDWLDIGYSIQIEIPLAPTLSKPVSYSTNFIGEKSPVFELNPPCRAFSF